MKKDVFITGLASFFPNSPVSAGETQYFNKMRKDNVTMLKIK